MSEGAAFLKYMSLFSCLFTTANFFLFVHPRSRIFFTNTCPFGLVIPI